ncbi:MAG TPA: cyclic nucleotide-binding/CBS domain-containing protein [Nitrospirae bacterium]|nr:cyclic nucleotide-binding/CBS domain-containing protein [Nitrospirota bacterium]
MITEDVVKFLKTVIPFQFLKEDELIAISEKTLLEFYPQNTILLKQEGPPSDNLKIIKKGSVKIYAVSNTGEEIITDYRGEGELIGYLSLFSDNKSRVSVMTLEDTLCYIISKTEMRAIIDRHPNIKDFFHQSFLKKYLDKTLEEMHSKTLNKVSGDMLLFTTPVGMLATKGVISVFQDTSIKEAAEIMTRHEISSVVIIDSNAVPVGIVTDRDLRKKVIAKGLDTRNSICSIMSVSLIKSDSKEYCFEALLKMIRYNIHHLLIVEDGKIKGIITNHDLMMLQGSSPVTVAKDIEIQQTVDGVAQISNKLNSIMDILIKEGAKASNITKIMSEINDRILKKILTLAEKKFGPPPTSYCWIVFGSEGRKEQTFKTDQDNAIICADPETLSEDEETKRYFSVFTKYVRDSLVMCGFPVCPGNYMASNPKWRQPISVWKSYFSSWINVPKTEAILASVILFDFRAIHGDFTLAEELKRHLLTSLKGKDMFLLLMAKMTVNVKPPLSFFKTFVVEKDGMHKNKFNIKFKFLSPLINVVRLFALEKRIEETSTLERIERLMESHDTIRQMGDELKHAFEFIMMMKIVHQFNQLTKGLQPDNYIDPNDLTNLEKKTLKESCQVISRVQESIENRYLLGRLSG